MVIRIDLAELGRFAVMKTLLWIPGGLAIVARILILSTCSPA